MTKNYPNKLLDIANKINLLRKEFSNFRLVEKILMTILEKYKTSITWKIHKICLQLLWHKWYTSYKHKSNGDQWEKIMQMKLLYFIIGKDTPEVTNNKRNYTTTHKFFHLISIVRKIIINITSVSGYMQKATYAINWYVKKICKSQNP